MPGHANDSLFVEYLRQGPGADFEALCAAHPIEEARLREWRAAYETTLAQLRAAGLTALPAPTGPASDALASGAPASGELLRRIVAQGAKGARYRLRGEIARGGMGAILRVWDEDLGRELAMKVVLGSDGDSSRAGTPQVEGRRIARFLEEAQITGQLDHPCIVPVHELGLDSQGQVYFTMRLVKGRDLGHIFDLVHAGQEGWTETRALNVLLRVCEAMAFAHSKGVIHRDLKPANVMVGSFGEVYVMDWGLARVVGRADVNDIRLRSPSQGNSIRTARREERGKAADSGSSSGSSDSPLMTMDGDVVGTPAYMPPEQARGRIEELSARSDVYAIGAMLYHLLGRRMPFSARGSSQNNLDILNALLEHAPTPLSELREDLPAELDAICSKAMDRDAAQRYGDTLELAEDLRAYLEGRVVKAYQTGAIVELRKWVARNKPLAAAGAAAILFLIAGLIGSLWQKSVADSNFVLAAQQAAEATKQGELAKSNAALAEKRALEADVATRRAEAVRDFLSEMLSNANPRNSFQRDMPVSEIVGDALGRLDAGEFASDPQTAFALRNTLGDMYQGLGLFPESERQFRIASELLTQLPAPDPKVKISLELDLAETLVATGAFMEGETRAKAALAEMSAANLSDTILHPRALQLLSSSRYNLGSTDEAIELTREAIALREKLEGPSGDRVATMHAHLAFLLDQKGLLDEALTEVEQALSVLQAPESKGRVEATGALRTRASIREKQRRHTDALADLTEALRVREELFGPENIYVADILGDLAQVELHTGKHESGEAHARRALELRRKFSGDHRDTATSLATLGSLLAAQGNTAQARLCFEESLAMRRKVLPADSPAIGDCLRRLGSLAFDEGDLANAERLLREALANWKLRLGVDHPDNANVLLDLAKVLRKQARDPEARAMLEQALAIRTAKFGETSPAANEARDALITLSLDTQDWQAAEQLLLFVLPKYKESLRAGHPVIAYSGAQLGVALVGQKRYDEAEPLLLAGWAAIGEDPRFWAVNKLVILDGLVALYSGRGDENEAVVWREKAEALRK